MRRLLLLVLLAGGCAEGPFPRLVDLPRQLDQRASVNLACDRLCGVMRERGTIDVYGCGVVGTYVLHHGRYMEEQWILSSSIDRERRPAMCDAPPSD